MEIPLSLPHPNWTPLSILSARCMANLKALASRDKTLADRLFAVRPSIQYCIGVGGDRVLIGTGTPHSIVPIESPVLPQLARQYFTQLFPTGVCDRSVLVIGEDQGWLWDYIYKAPCQVPVFPGHRPPAYFLIRSLERLWVILHLQDWRQMLTDPRVNIFAGDDAFVQLQNTLARVIECPWPTTSCTIDAAPWPGGVSLNDVVSAANAERKDMLASVRERLAEIYADLSAGELAFAFSGGRPLRVLGITSLYTTFLQHSMRDWLAAFEELGHCTRLVIERADHTASGELLVARACTEFRPDILIVIDHFRAEIGEIPVMLPVVMWVQDRLPNIYDPYAGHSQARLDYVIGYGRQELSQRMNYPALRFMPATVGVNPSRFSGEPLTTAQCTKYQCEVSFVSNSTTSADIIIAREIEQAGSPQGRKLLDDIYQQLLAIYKSGRAVTSGPIIRALILQTMERIGTPANIEPLLHLFTQRVNNALFRHQALRWVAAMGVDVHLYGKGWEAHPEFARFARGIADSRNELPLIYKASAINLQVTPFGAVHQRMLEGLAAGGFFLLRSVEADAVEACRQRIHEWCRRMNARTGAEMLFRADPELHEMFTTIKTLSGVNPADDMDYFQAGIEEAAMTGFTRTPNTLWPESAQVTFASESELSSLIHHFLANPTERASLVKSMRHRVIETHTYRAITSRMTDFIASDLAQLAAKQRPPLAA